MRRQPILSFLEARSLISSACPIFLACLVSLTAGESLDSRVPYDVPVVSEFVDVFPDELPSLPPHREVEFVALTLSLALPQFLKPHTTCPRLG